MNKQKGYYSPDFTNFFLLLIILGTIFGYALSFILPFIWISVVKPLLLTLV